MNRLSDRINSLEESQTIGMAQKSRELAAKGIDVISLSLGEPDFPTPTHIKDAAKKAIDDGFTFYPPIAGFPDLRQAISEKFARENNLTYKPEQIVVSTGAKQAIANVVLSLINPGDEVIVPQPYWVSYVEIIKLAEGAPVLVDADIAHDFKITAAQLEAAITPKTRLFIFSSPCNPTGSVYTADELASLVKVFEKYPNIIIMSDEIYEHINFVDKHVSIAEFESVKERVVVVNGVSKGYSMTGWRIGYIGAPLWIAKACDKMQGQFTSGASSVSQKAALAAISGTQQPTVDMQKAFLHRRDLVLGLLKEIQGFRTQVPQGAFYVFPDVSAYLGKSFNGVAINTTADLCMYLLNEAHVAIVTGEAFGAPNCVRISYATSEDKLTEACKRIKEALLKLS